MIIYYSELKYQKLPNILNSFIKLPILLLMGCVRNISRMRIHNPITLLGMLYDNLLLITVLIKGFEYAPYLFMYYFRNPHFYFWV